MYISFPFNGQERADSAAAVHHQDVALEVTGGSLLGHP